jgi:uncharacterized protein
MYRLLSIFILIPLFLQAQNSINGDWDGKILIGAVQLNITVHFMTQEDKLSATIDIPQQGAKDLILQNVRFNNPSVYFELPAEPGLAKFDGKLKNNKIEGSFTKGVAVGSFYLQRPVEKTRPKTKAFNEEELNIQNGDFNLAGTLVTPKTNQSVPAVVLVTGSGPQNRDEEIYGFKIFENISTHLVNNGIAVLRYDDRGFGDSGGDFKNATTKDFAGDARAAVNYLRKNSGINISAIGVLGHSEGGAIASMLAANPQNNLDFIVMMAGPAMQGDALLYAQSELINKASGVSETEIKKQHDLQTEIFKTIRSGNNWDNLENIIRTTISEKINAMPTEQANQIPDTKAYIEQMTSAQIQSVQSPWMRFFIDYDPANDLSKINIPVFALYGAKDLQVPAGQNAERLEQIFARAGKDNLTLVTFPDANHLFQRAETGNISEYPLLKKEFVTGFMDKISSWIKQQSSDK